MGKFAVDVVIDVVSFRGQEVDNSLELTWGVFGEHCHAGNQDVRT